MDVGCDRASWEFGHGICGLHSEAGFALLSISWQNRDGVLLQTSGADYWQAANLVQYALPARTLGAFDIGTKI